MNEFELIQRLTPLLAGNASVVVGAGDDCAVLNLGLPDQWVLFKTDAVVQGIHFTEATPPEKIGHKALGRCLSDIAAMAGTPRAALVTLALPSEFDPKYVEAIYVGMNALAGRFDVAVVGGETTTNPERLLISISLLGTVARGKAALRSGAQVGDAIFVTGELGGSLVGKHLEFEPRLLEARWLAEHFALHAMMDISDGLAGDLPHLLKASGVGAELLSSAIPISRAARSRRREEAGRGAQPETPPPYVGGYARIGGHKAPLHAALTDGEDFELLFTVAGKDAVPLLDAWHKRFPELPLGCIGRIIAGQGITMRDRSGARPLTAHGYTHFA